MNFRLLFQHLKSMKHYIIAATLVFVVGWIIGFTNSEQFAAFIEQQLKGIEDIASRVQEAKSPQLTLFWLIFFNNVMVSLLCIFAGIFFGLLPLFSLLVNGMVLGYVGAVQGSGDQWAFYLKGILPHGILEIPAIIIACAYGIRFGMTALKGIFTIVSPRLRKNIRNEFVGLVRLSLPLSLFLGVVLLVAAVIESTVTLWLLSF